ncbi:major histocompatibility complex class I-related gene protein-like isoform X2 [Ahaetulla prasina]|uniref:major histocompatibility complex class I-related gene protein-like isoform X2 n=1 Tax=Ahaetulla prasina TaxID=499056 RepID=UPI00264921A0|nr:major histocompatibility complex class I-related gene protein-like isoform X2 [Ahaetulla prasina]
MEAVQSAATSMQGDPKWPLPKRRPLKGTKSNQVRIGQASADPEDKEFTMVGINGQQIEIEVDTGSSITIVSCDNVTAILSHIRKDKLEHQRFRVQDYQGNRILMEGIATVNVTYSPYRKQLPVTIIRGNLLNLLGMDWIRVLGMGLYGVIGIHATHQSLKDDLLREFQDVFSGNLGLHTWQEMYGCELRGDGSKGGFNQYGYDGRTFINFDKKTLTWVASEPQAQITQRKWNAIPGEEEGTSAYLDEICIEWLEKLLSYGNEMLLRTETPKVTMSSRTEVEDGMETHVCHVHGFYPREIDASWTRDGEVWLHDTLHASVAPNADGTYHYWLSVRIDPKERDRYRCHVEHDSLQEPLDMALKEPTNSKSSLGLIIGCVVVAALVLVCLIAGILVFLKRRQDDYNAAPSE